MGKAPSHKSGAVTEISGESRSFQQAALSGRFIGVATLTLGAISLYAGRQAAASASRDAGMIYIIFSLLFIVPGMLYLVLATFVARRKRWAIITSLLLAMLDMTLLGILFVTSWGAPGAAMMCVLAGLFVAALAVMTTFLGRSLEIIRRSTAQYPPS